uniref:30S ribosomal protein S7 n=1 Tax=Nephromyces sp. ex Molgula occidentalis TaxID=2544991 RepID=A0A5C1H7E8_9APIC|nr:30S ribosomal protein S7 [Nephromyces sp. ex Molgula occidentalis]
MKHMVLKIKKIVDLNMELKKHKYKGILDKNSIYSPLIILILQKFQKNGKLKLSHTLLKKCFILLKNNNFNSFELLLEESLNKIKSPVVLYSKKIRGSKYKIPYRLNLKKSILKAISLLNKSSKLNNINFSKSLSLELLNILNNKGISISNKQNLIKQALTLRVNF